MEKNNKLYLKKKSKLFNSTSQLPIENKRKIKTENNSKCICCSKGKKCSSKILYIILVLIILIIGSSLFIILWITFKKNKNDKKSINTFDFKWKIIEEEYNSTSNSSQIRI